MYRVRKYKQRIKYYIKTYSQVVKNFDKYFNLN